MQLHVSLNFSLLMWKTQRRQLGQDDLEAQSCWPRDMLRGDVYQRSDLILQTRQRNHQDAPRIRDAAEGSDISCRGGSSGLCTLGPTNVTLHAKKYFESSTSTNRHHRRAACRTAITKPEYLSVSPSHSPLDTNLQLGSKLSCLNVSRC